MGKSLSIDIDEQIFDNEEILQKHHGENFYNLIYNIDWNYRVYVNTIEKKISVYKRIDLNKHIIWKKNGKKISFYKNWNLITNNIFTDFETEIFYEKIFIPKEETTILLKISKNVYVILSGREIKTFVSDNEIIDFYSPIRNNMIPNSFAIDTEGIIYLVFDSVKFPSPNKKILKKYYNDDITYYFYSNGLNNNFSKIIYL